MLIDDDIAVGAEGTVYAKDESRPAVFTLESAIVDELKKDGLQYRQKDLFDARAFNTTRIELTKGADKFLFEKKTEKDKDGTTPIDVLYAVHDLYTAVKDPAELTTRPKPLLYSRHEAPLRDPWQSRPDIQPPKAL